MYKKALVVASLFIVSSITGCVSDIYPKDRYSSIVFEDVTVHKDVVYGRAYDYTGNLTDLLMDIYEPKGDFARKRALVIVIHGGGFVAGDKASGKWVKLCTLLAKMGYVAASINYRLQPRVNFNKSRAITEAMYDAKAAVRFFRAHADDYRIDPDRIALIGASAGAITALHVTYLREPEFEGDSGNPGYSSNVTACVDLWGGLYENVTEIDPGEPPVLIIHGTEDKVVPYSEAENISKRCEEVGVHYSLHPLEGAGHAPWDRCKEFLPWILDFLYKYCARKDESIWPLQSTPKYKNSFWEELASAKTIMWLGAHPDDELYTAGTFGYFTRDLKGHLVIVSLYYNPKFVESNDMSAEFLGGADYIRIEEQIGGQLPRCKKWNQLDEVIEELEERGVKDYIKQLVKEYKPDIVIGFESTNGFRHSCQHVTAAKLLDKALLELREDNISISYYYTLNRDPGWFGPEKMDPPPVTDIINLSDEMWSYKLKLFEIYSPFYPTLSNETWINGLQHREFFRKVDLENITNIEITFAKPKPGYLYLLNRKLFYVGKTVVIGGITVEISVKDENHKINEINFCIDGEIKFTDDAPPYRWFYNSRGIGRHVMGVEAETTGGETIYIEQEVWTIL